MRQAEALRLPGEEDAAMAGVDTPLHLDHRRVDVPERRRHDRDQPAMIGRRPVAQEVVVRAYAHEPQLVVTDAQEPLAADAGPRDVHTSGGSVRWVSASTISCSMGAR